MPRNKKARKKGRWRERRGQKEVVSSNKSTFIHSTWGGSSITRAFEIFEALPTSPGITLEIDVARPRNLRPFRLLDFSRTSLFLLNRLETRKGYIYYTCRDPGAARGIRREYMTRKVLYRVKINILQKRDGKKNVRPHEVWWFIALRATYLKCPRNKFHHSCDRCKTDK